MVRPMALSTPAFWGVFREVFGVRSKIWALEVPFFDTRKQALLAKVEALQSEVGVRTPEGP